MNSELRKNDEEDLKILIDRSKLPETVENAEVKLNKEAFERLLKQMFNILEWNIAVKCPICGEKVVVICDSFCVDEFNEAWWECPACGIELHLSDITEHFESKIEERSEQEEFDKEREEMERLKNIKKLEV